MTLITISLLFLGILGALSAIVLYTVSRKFTVYEDPMLAEVEAILPAANCGGCGYPGCKGFAAACVDSQELNALHCPVGGNATMQAVAEKLGKNVVDKDPKIAVVRCNGTCENRPHPNKYDGVKHCYIAHNLYSGETACGYGCLGFGDCAVSCDFDAIHIDPLTQLPVVDEIKCTACGACVKACPKLLIELRNQGPAGKRIYVSCRNQEKGTIAGKQCSVACIACSKCVKVCPSDAITVEKNLAYIDEEICTLCGLCVPVCPTNAIVLKTPDTVPA